MQVNAFRTTAQCKAVAPSRFKAWMSAPFCSCATGQVSQIEFRQQSLTMHLAAIRAARSVPIASTVVHAGDCLTLPSAVEDAPARKVTQ